MSPRSRTAWKGGPAIFGLLLSLTALEPAICQPLTLNTTSNQIGRLTSMGDGRMRRFLEYDALGRASRTEHRLEAGAYVFGTTFGYPQGSGVAGPGTVARTQTFPDGEVVTYGYDASGAQRTLTATRPGFAAQNVVNDVRRNALGQTVQVFYGNGTVTTHTYNDATDLRLNRIQTTGGAGIVQDYVYGFDANGNVTSVSDGVVPAFSATYGYDSLDQLTSMTSGSTVTYGYDSAGNMTSKEGAALTYGGTGRGPHALASAGGATYFYDFNGNTVSTSAGLELTWNAENMATVATVGGVVKNRKSFLGEMLWKKVENGTTTLYLPSLLLENGTPRKFFGPFAERSPDGSLKFYHGDHLGSSTVVTDASQVVVHRIAYKPYGEDRGVAGGSFMPRYQFNFKEKESTGFYDYGARLYNPVTGRWLSADDSVSDGLNRYTYTANNPLSYTDPTGHDIEVIVTSQVAGKTYVTSAPGGRGNREAVSSYRVIIKNSKGDRVEFIVSRDTNVHGKANATRGRYGQGGETPPGTYQGKLRTDGSKGFRIELTQQGQKDGQILTPDGYLKTNAQIHIGPGCSEGCFLLNKGTSGREAFTNSIDALIKADGQTRANAKITVTVQPRNSREGGHDQPLLPTTKNGKPIVDETGSHPGSDLNVIIVRPVKRPPQQD